MLNWIIGKRTVCSFHCVYLQNVFTDHIFNIQGRKDDMIPFPFNKNRFSFFVADQQLVGQLCTNPKSDKSLLSCRTMTQCSTSEIGDAPLYKSCSLPIQLMTTGPLPAPSKCKSGLPRITGTCPGWWKQSFRLRLWSLVWFQVRATSCHLISSKSAWKSTSKCSWMCWRVWWFPGAIRWPVADPGLSAGPQVQRDPGLASEGVLRLCTLLSLAPLLPRPETAGLLRLVIGREHHQHELPQHQSQPDRRYPPSIRRAPAGACWKGMLPVPDPYRGVDWGRRRLHWIDVSFTT